MIPKILEYIDGHIVITPEAAIIKELNDLINKHGNPGAEPYLAFAHLKTHPESPYANLPYDEIDDTITFDIIQSIGDFDIDEPLLRPAIERLLRHWDTADRRYYESLKIGMDKTSRVMRDEEITTGRDGNYDSIQRSIRDAGATLKSFKTVEKIVDEDTKAKMKGKSVLGDY
jgi:hypothetical protein